MAPPSPDALGAGRGTLRDDGVAPIRCWLFFLPGAFTPVCTAELGWVDELAERLAPAGIGLRVVSCDSAAVLRKVTDETGIRTPLLSDFWPHGAAARAVGEFNESTGRARRSSVLMDAAGRVLARIRATVGDERRLQDHLDAVPGESSTSWR
ncbi:redoxin domain-containing protein [Citricoccus sp.]|uniref:redoxin domain-containing protein n=1 Tax=Citricoccus sp. TaxID=1978372 RepID=UPI0028BED4B1|nr:redoxin domain-containing protein [Citricoccus sp.]